MAPDASPVGAGLIAAWNFDEGAGTLLADVSGNGHDARYSDGSAWSSMCP
jgi:hypothetical protein